MPKKQSRNSYVFILSSILTTLPIIASAQVKTLSTVINTIIYYLNQILVLMIGFAVVMFIWYIIQYFIRPDTDKKDAGTYVMYSLIGFFVILSFWGLVNILQNTFGLKNETNQPASWTSFKGLFPSGNSGSTGATNVSPFTSGSTGATNSSNQSPVIMAPYLKDPTATRAPAR